MRTTAVQRRSVSDSQAPGLHGACGALKSDVQKIHVRPRACKCDQVEWVRHAAAARSGHEVQALQRDAVLGDRREDEEAARHCEDALPRLAALQRRRGVRERGGRRLVAVALHARGRLGRGWGC